MKKDMKVAVLIDAENISSKYVHTILQEASGLGNIIYKRIYGNWTSSQLGSWKQELLDHAIQPVQQYSNTQGKNSSDSALIIDAMDLLYQNKLDAFCIVSSDSDFTRLATRLRESEMYVLGMGEKKTPRAFISACNKFVYLDVLAGQKKKRSDAKEKSTPRKRVEVNTDQPTNSTPETSADETKNTRPPVGEPWRGRVGEARKQAEVQANLEKAAKEDRENRFVEDDQDSLSEGTNIVEVTDALVSIIEEYSDDEGWIPASNFANLLSRRLSDFDVRNFGFKKFVPFVQSLKMFEDRSVASTDDPNVKAIYFRLIEE